MRALYIIIPIQCILPIAYGYLKQGPTHVEILGALPGEHEDRVQAQTAAGRGRACVSIAARTH
jgi:hypothetical protein